MEIAGRLIEVARSLFMRYGIRSVTMEDITREMGVSKKTLYQVVDNKEDLVHQVLAHKLDEDVVALKQIQVEAIDAIDEMLRVTRYILANLRDLSPAVVFDLNKYYGSIWKKVEGVHKQQTYLLIRDNLKRGISQGLYRENINPDIIARLYVAKSSLIVDEGLFPSAEYHPATLFEETILYHMHGVASSRGLILLEKHLYEK